MATYWIWQQPDWPDFNWQAERLAPLLRECVQAQGQLMGMAGSVGDSLGAQTALDALLQNIVTSSAIEGEQLNVGSVRSSLARRLGLELIDGDKVSQRSEGLAQLMLDATRRFAEPLILERLLEWHQWLFPDQEADLTARSMHVGALRGDEPMQVVSGRIDRPTVHFEAPPRQGLEQQLDQFLQWFEASQHQTALDPMLRAGIAHFWFVTLHPFNDGNGRLTRTIMIWRWHRAKRKPSVSTPCRRAFWMIGPATIGFWNRVKKPHWTSLNGSHGSCKPCYAVCNKPSPALKACWARRVSGRHTASPNFRRSRSKCSIVCSTAASGALSTASVPGNIKRWRKCRRPQQPDTLRSCWRKVAFNACREGVVAPAIRSTIPTELHINLTQHRAISVLESRPAHLPITPLSASVAPV